MAFFIVEVDNEGFKVLDSGGTAVDPAEDATVAAITTELQAIQATTGIKAIIDPLPAGTNNIGDVDLASAIPAGVNIIGLIKLVDTAGVNVLAVNASGQAAIQDPPNLDAALSTRATEATLASIKDTDGVKKITDPLPAGTNTLGQMKVVDGGGTNLLNVDSLGKAGIQNQPNMDVALSTRASETTLATADGRLATIDSVLDSIKDTDGIKKITDQLPAGTNEIGKVAQGTKGAAANGWPTVVYDASGNALAVIMHGTSIASGYGVAIMGRDNADAARFLLTDDSGRLAVTPSPPTAPPGTTAYSLAVNEAELDVGSGGDVASPHTTLGAIIGNSVNLYLQTVSVGTEGDTSENGSVVEVYWRTSGPTDHLISRIYVAGETVEEILSDTNAARDGTQMTGDGTNTRLVVVRRRLSTAALEIDFVIRGFTV